jgi:hypothetical protein
LERPGRPAEGEDLAPSWLTVPGLSFQIRNRCTYYAVIADATSYSRESCLAY